ncbi:MAG TPA: GNAT family N-acetyltransferase [Candidatus Dormibacteraeota bacterium]|nr:GNAT family N-acetyltransferase [Candidatus Dormibacteraeota bacterium]
MSRPIFPVVAAVGRARADELLSGHPFEVVQVMVEPATQRQGIGRALLERLIADMGRAWLVTLPESPASRLYRSAGWQPLQLRLSLWGRELEVWVRGP